MIEDFERCYRAVTSRDPRFDGWFFTAVTSTGIYCRPSCPALTPRRRNVRFYRSAAAAVAAGYRACRRCRPDVAPGAPEWNIRADVVARAMRLIADGVVDREGVAGLSTRLGYSERHLHRQLVAEVGAGPLALARAQRAQTARVLIETTSLPFAEVAFAAGFSSVRQFNDTVAAVFATTPTELRRRPGGSCAEPAGATINLRLAYRRPMAATSLLEFLTGRAVPGVEEVEDGVYRRTVRLPHAAAVIELSPGDGYIHARARLDDLRDLTAAVGRIRWLLDLDADPTAVSEVLAKDPVIGRRVLAEPGRRVPHAIGGAELAVRAVLGQHISVAGARTLAGRLAARYGKPLTSPSGSLTHLFPEPGILAEADPSELGVPRGRAQTIIRISAAIADGDLAVDPAADREETERVLGRIKGVGPWTASYILMRALGDPDAFPATDLGLRKAAATLGADPDRLETTARGWRPWRAYAAEHLWSTLREAV